LPNFRWRQAAIDAHDRHHVITGYPLTIAGEIQLAAWEWGAGRYPDWRATAFCAPLIIAGALTMPRQTLNAFRRGKRMESLYHNPRRPKVPG
jgi:ubiquinone biosynthesis protein Coq4